MEFKATVILAPNTYRLELMGLDPSRRTLMGEWYLGVRNRLGWSFGASVCIYACLWICIWFC